MLAAMVIACGLLHPMPVCGQHFSAMGQRVKRSDQKQGPTNIASPPAVDMALLGRKFFKDMGSSKDHITFDTF